MARSQEGDQRAGQVARWYGSRSQILVVCQPAAVERQGDPVGLVVGDGDRCADAHAAGDVVDDDVVVAAAGREERPIGGAFTRVMKPRLPPNVRVGSSVVVDMNSNEADPADIQVVTNAVHDIAAAAR